LISSCDTDKPDNGGTDGTKYLMLKAALADERYRYRYIPVFVVVEEFLYINKGMHIFLVT
jgi:hypothetical protein